MINGKPSSDGVERRSIHRLQLDDIGPELHLFPSGFVVENNPHYVIDFVNYSFEDSSSLELMGVENLVVLPGQRTAYSTVPIIGALWYGEKNELWLLQSPQEQWPKEWFA